MDKVPPMKQLYRQLIRPTIKYLANKEMRYVYLMQVLAVGFLLCMLCLLVRTLLIN
jgi:hypothetical protein